VEPFHWLVVIALGVTWALDGLEVTIVGALGSVLEEPGTLGLTATQVGLAGTSYIAGALVGALLFGHLTDRHGRRRLFLITLSLYVVATCATAFSVDFWTFAACRFLTGMGIGGEYAAINSAIDELIPARTRGIRRPRDQRQLLGRHRARRGALAVLLDPRVLGHELGWRAAFGLGAVLALGIMIVRRFVPESPRWLMVRGRHAEAEAIVAAIEASCAAGEREGELPRIRIAMHERIGFRTIARVVFTQYRSRALLGLALMIAQAFFYNAIFFTYGLTSRTSTTCPTSA
jgi:MFS family permease